MLSWLQETNGTTHVHISVATVFVFGIGKSAHMTVIYLGKSVLSLYGVLSIGIVVHPDVITNITSCLLSINLPTYITPVIQKCWLF